MGGRGNEFRGIAGSDRRRRGQGRLADESHVATRADRHLQRRVGERPRCTIQDAAAMRYHCGYTIVSQRGRLLL